MLWDYIYERSSGHNNFRVLVQLPKGDIDAGAWSLIPLTSESGRGQEQESLSRSWHSGCWTSDFRVLLDDSPGWSPLVVVEAHRDTGRSPTAAAPVTFTIYRLRHQPGRTSGTPQYQFLRQAAFRSKSVYCDLGEAFRAELAIERAEP